MIYNYFQCIVVGLKINCSAARILKGSEVKEWALLIALQSLGFRLNHTWLKCFLLWKDSLITFRLAREKHFPPWWRGLWNTLSHKLIQILLNISVLLLSEYSRNLVSVLCLVEVTLMLLGSIYITMFCSSNPNIYPYMVAINWLIFISFTEQGWKCYQQVTYYQKYFMKMHYWILSQSPLSIVILPMILILSLNMFISICKFSLYLLIMILCFQLGCEFIVYSNPDFLFDM